MVQTDIKKIKTLGELKASGYKTRSIKDEIRSNLIAKMKEGDPTFEGILGYEDSVIPDVERALLSKHNILFFRIARTSKNKNGKANDTVAG